MPEKTLWIIGLPASSEVDECFILASHKGERRLPRKARKRSGKAEKPGLSGEQTPVLIARDRYGHHLDAVLPNRSEDAVSAVLKKAVSKHDVLLCMDGDPALIAFAKREAIEYELIIARRGEYAHESVLQVQTVNSYVSRFKKWMIRFKGVATKYLQNWRLVVWFLQVIPKSREAVRCLSMRSGITVSVARDDRLRLEGLVSDRCAPQKHVWRARIILATADGCGTTEIMRRSGKSKPVVWRWQERFMEEGVDGLLRDKTRRACQNFRVRTDFILRL